MKTDQQLQQDVNAELLWEPAVHAAHVGVEVKDGVVTLAGEVDSYAEKWNAEHAAQRVSGVQALAVDLTVKLSGPNTRTDADIAGSVQSVLEWTSALPANAVQVMVEDGWVTLSGDVNWQFQKLAAADCVRHMWGVRGVHNQIYIKPALSASAIQADIEAALWRTAVVEGGHISVTVDGQDVILSGTVHNWTERKDATSSAWRTPGVRNVVDKMTLSY
jgi:osmotically-inducible protein OsmY